MLLLVHVNKILERVNGLVHASSMQDRCELAVQHTCHDPSYVLRPNEALFSIHGHLKIHQTAKNTTTTETILN
jgi:hypothetical protein